MVVIRGNIANRKIKSGWIYSLLFGGLSGFRIIRIFRSIIGMEVLVGGNWFRLYMASVFGVTFFQFSPLRNIIKLFQTACRFFKFRFSSIWSQFLAKSKKLNTLGPIFLSPSAIAAGISKSNWDMLEGVV